MNNYNLSVKYGTQQYVHQEQSYNVLEIIICDFPYLDLEFLKGDDKKTETKAHQKEHQKLKCINKGSAYSNATFKSTLCGIFYHIGKLTSKTDRTIA